MHAGAGCICVENMYALWRITQRAGDVTPNRYMDVIMTTIASEITSVTVVYLTGYSDADQRKHRSSASLAFVWGTHRDWGFPRTKGQLRGKCFQLMTSSWEIYSLWYVCNLALYIVIAIMKQCRSQSSSLTKSKLHNIIVCLLLTLDDMYLFILRLYIRVTNIHVEL